MQISELNNVTAPSSGTDLKKHDNDAFQIERVLSPDDMRKEHMNYDRVDGELAAYASDAVVEISEEESKRLKRMIDKRILLVMVVTYFIQALDKGTMSFASIMNIRKDLHLEGQQVCTPKYDGHQQ